MRWLNSEARIVVPAKAKLALLSAAIAKRPDDPALQSRLGDALLRSGDATGAITTYERAAAHPAFAAWPRLAGAYMTVGQPERALDAAVRGEAKGAVGMLSYQRGRALLALHRLAEARAALEQALAMGDESLLALKMLLDPLAADPGGGKLLDFCEGLSERYQRTALVLAHRAIALSKLRRVKDARRLVDLDRHIRRVRFVPPTEFGGIDAFNRTLTDEILTDPQPEPSALEGFEITYLPPSHGRPAMAAILDFMRREYVSYINALPALGLIDVLPPPPDAAMLYGASLVLRNDGSNGEHIHGKGYVSAVYHVSIPDGVWAAQDGRGALIFGECEGYTRGHKACWGTRLIKPVAGWLTLFPSHIFHDVVPTRSRQPRISVSSDLWPMRDSG